MNEANAAWTGATATASGSVQGGNSVGVNTPFGRVSSCPGGGNGELVIDGTYQHSSHSEEVFHYETTVAFGDDVAVSTPYRPGLKLDQAHIEIRRKGCGIMMDSLDFPVNAATTSQTSKNGFFLATIDGGQLTVKGVNLK